MTEMELPYHTDGKSNSGSPGLNKGSSKRVNAVLHCKKSFFYQGKAELKGFKPNLVMFKLEHY